jgi:hypothetical protein
MAAYAIILVFKSLHVPIWSQILLIISPLILSGRKAIQKYALVMVSCNLRYFYGDREAINENHDETVSRVFWEEFKALCVLL